MGRSKLQEVIRKSKVNKGMLLLSRFQLLPSLLIRVKKFSHPLLSNREESLLQMEISLINVNFSYKKEGNFYLVFRASPVSAVS